MAKHQIKSRWDESVLFECDVPDDMASGLRTELNQYDAPRCPSGQFEYIYEHPELGALECHLEHEPAAPEAGWNEEATLHTAYLRGVEITDRLSGDEVKAIEHAALKQPYQEIHHAD